MEVRDVTAEFQGYYHQTRLATPIICLHHADWQYSPGIAAVRSVHKYHLERWGTGVAYHECLVEEADGSIVCYVTSDPNTLRYGVAYENHRAFHISALTNFKSSRPEQKWIDAYRERVAAARTRWPTARVVGHTDIAHAGWYTSCPAGLWPDWKADVLQDAIPEVPDETVVIGIVAQRMSEHKFIDITRRRGFGISPTEAGRIYQFCYWLGVDARFVLALTLSEHGEDLSTVPRFLETRNWGNQVHYHDTPLLAYADPNGRTYVEFESSQLSGFFLVWWLKEVYGHALGLRTVEAIIPIYLNDPDYDNDARINRILVDMQHMTDAGG